MWALSLDNNADRYILIWVRDSSIVYGKLVHTTIHYTGYRWLMLLSDLALAFY